MDNDFKEQPKEVTETEEISSIIAEAINIIKEIMPRKEKAQIPDCYSSNPFISQTTYSMREY